MSSAGILKYFTMSLLDTTSPSILDLYGNPYTTYIWQLQQLFTLKSNIRMLFLVCLAVF